MMTAQKSTQLATSRGEQGGGQRGQQGLARRTGVPSLPSLLLDPLGFFDDDPFSLFRRMQRDMNRVFGQAGLDVSRRGDEFLSTAWAPAMEISYSDGKLIVSAELPGLTEKDVNVEINNDFLVIQGERKVEHEEGDGGIRRTERRYGEFYRAVALPEGADVENASAEFRNGVLQVVIPVPQAPSNVRQIPVQAAAGQSQQQAGEQRQSANESASGQKAA
jgi:HSP20 family protein